MKIPSLRMCYVYAFLSTIVLMLLAIYLEFIKGIIPCPLCILQRGVLIGLGIGFFIGILVPLKKTIQMMIGLLCFFLSLCGVLLAGRQVWLQHLPLKEVPDCGVSLQYLIKVLPIDQVVRKIFQGSAECSLVDWSFLTLTLAEWSLGWFLLYAMFSLYQTLRK